MILSPLCWLEVLVAAVAAQRLTRSKAKTLHFMKTGIYWNTSRSDFVAHCDPTPSPLLAVFFWSSATLRWVWVKIEYPNSWMVNTKTRLKSVVPQVLHFDSNPGDERLPFKHGEHHVICRECTFDSSAWNVHPYPCGAFFKWGIPNGLTLG